MTQIILSYSNDRFPEQLLKIQETKDPYILFIVDVFDSDYIRKINDLKNTPLYIVNDSLNSLEITNGVCYCANFWLELEINKFFRDLPVQEILTTDHAFNFIINKKQVNRFLCLKFVEYFQLTNYDYTWSGIDSGFDMSAIIKELDTLDNVPDDIGYILSPTTIPEKFFYLLDPPVRTSYSVQNYGNNLQTWQNGLGEIFAKSAISLITESVSYQRGITFSEKTLYSVLGLTFPIWIGGYRQCDEWKKTGFDTFDDVINHNYQHYDTLFERCYYAFKDNLDLLTSIDRARELRNLHKTRLEKNRDLILNGQIKKFNDDQLQSWPGELTNEIMPTILKLYRT
jgi:hypothetical protein